MKLEKILLGDDNLEFAREAMPYIPGAEITFVSSPEELVTEARTGNYTTIITDLQYTPQGTEGYKILEELEDLDARKILWTGVADQEEVKEKAKELGAELLDKDELGTLVGMTVSKAPLKEGGKVLVYMPAGENSSIYRAMKQVIEVFCDPDKVVLGSNLKEELRSGEYGLVIDTTTMPTSIDERSRTNGSVAHDMKYLKLDEVPKVACVHDVTRVVADIAQLVTDFYKN